MTIKLLTEHHLEFLHLKEGCTGLYESTLVKMPHCWKSHVMAHFTATHCAGTQDKMKKLSSCGPCGRKSKFKSVAFLLCLSIFGSLHFVKFVCFKA